MADLITNKDTRALNKYPPDGSDMGPVREGTPISSTGTNANGTWTGYKLPDGKFRCIPTIDLDPVGVTPPPVDPPPVIPPTGTGRIYHVLELVNGVWVSVKYLQEITEP